ncbi:glycosyltransferase family 4 protein [Roseibium salinum]|uniref:Glycosyltransferase family 4 protein n=1 Tax=Roseibium salinum TaxID=1604349 RepID=A0ABT3R1L1_9HYPH|nr:glycosyltransferase family 4 protein [Roseibium sp. DSM 29163]MCX2722842.1 glycosyltransferase family 4 protein [Roseibium sp. DSM 29163]
MNDPRAPGGSSANDMLRVLVVSHGHPNLSLGGAEVASYNLHQGLKSIPGAQSFFLARVGEDYPGHGRSALMGAEDADDELLYHADDYDPFLISNRNTADIRKDLRRLVRTLHPDVVHFHHFLGLGLEALYTVREALPNAAILVTFHEFLPLCHHHGQMVKTEGLKLCETASPISCHGCFPEIAPGAFLRRKQFIQSMLGLADAYISPSRFLADRYVQWGLPADNFSIIENGLNVSEKAEPRKLTGSRNRRSKFAFFGQMTPYKGVDILIDAVQRIPESVWGDDASLTIFGGNLGRQPEPFRKKIASLLEKAEDRVRFAGSYQNKDMPALMRQVDWVMMPSIWWENSPVIIQEAFFHGRPLICSDIGGMAEKVRNGIDGLHFRAASPEDLADRMIEILSNQGQWEHLHKGIQPPKTHLDTAQEHLNLYRAVIANRRVPRVELSGDLQQSA